MAKQRPKQRVAPWICIKPPYPLADLQQPVKIGGHVKIFVREDKWQDDRWSLSDTRSWKEDEGIIYFSVGTRREAEKLLVMTCPRAYDDNTFFSRELAQGLNAKNLKLFVKKLEHYHERLILLGWCECGDFQHPNQLSIFYGS